METVADHGVFGGSLYSIAKNRLTTVNLDCHTAWLMMQPQALVICSQPCISYNYMYQ